jgi:hypothetical protein
MRRRLSGGRDDERALEACLDQLDAALNLVWHSHGAAKAHQLVADARAELLRACLAYVGAHTGGGRPKSSADTRTVVITSEDTGASAIAAPGSI